CDSVRLVQSFRARATQKEPQSRVELRSWLYHSLMPLNSTRNKLALFGLKTSIARSFDVALAAMWDLAIELQFTPRFLWLRYLLRTSSSASLSSSQQRLSLAVGIHPLSLNHTNACLYRIATKISTLQTN